METNPFHIILYAFLVFIVFFLLLSISNLLLRKLLKNKKPHKAEDDLSSMSTSKQLVELEKIIKMKSEGYLSENEFEKLKKNILSQQQSD